jgi:DNA-binding transcriptional regulator YdaS (Cro superfamily)
MHLKTYFEGEPYGAKKEMSDFLGITPTWLGLLIKKQKRPSISLSKKIVKATQGLVTLKELRPDIFQD